MPNSTVTFSDGVDEIELPMPNRNFKTVIDLPFTYANLSYGKLKTYDPGIAYDIRSCLCTFELTEAQNIAFMEYMEDATKGRGINILTMTTTAGSGLFAFGPDKNPVGEYTVALDLVDTEGIGNAPYLYFHTRVRITNQGTFPAYSFPTDTDEGSWTFGTVAGIRFPPDWFKPKTKLAVFPSTGRSGIVSHLDRGITADAFNTSFKLTCNGSKASRIINYITGTSRATTFNITSSANSYVFGALVGDNGTYTVRIVQTQIVIEYINKNIIEFTLKLNYDSTV